MTFNHYAKIKQILKQYDSWVIKRINQPTKAKNFRGETVEFDYYYRIFDSKDRPIKYCKFQQIDRLAKALGIAVEELPVVGEDSQL